MAIFITFSLPTVDMKKLSAAPLTKVIPLRPHNQLASRGYDSLVDDWLRRFSSAHTRRIYSCDLRDFFQAVGGTDLTSELVAQFLNLDQSQAFELVSQYQGSLVSRGLAPSTINRKLAAVKSLVNYASECGKCCYTLSNIKAEKLKPYRDTSGISTETFKRMLSVVDTSTGLGKRNLAILLLLWGNALRRSELVQTNIGDFDPSEGTLRIYGKGRGNQAEVVTLGKQAIEAILDWLDYRGETDLDSPLFIAVHKSYYGHRLIAHSIWKLVKRYAKLAGITKPMSPHRIRHSSITAALDSTGGDVRAVQQLSRHSNLNTLMIYDDNRKNEQGRVTELLDDLV